MNEQEKSKSLANIAPTALQKYSASGVILREIKGEDKTRTTAHISALLLRLAKLYQIPSFDETSAVMLAEWVLESYQYESIDLVIRCLQKPPHNGEKNWRLTPDTIQSWMALELEAQAETREKQHEKDKSHFREIEAPAQISAATQRLIDSFLNQLRPMQDKIDHIEKREPRKPVPADPRYEQIRAIMAERKGVSWYPSKRFWVGKVDLTGDVIASISTDYSRRAKVQELCRDCMTIGADSEEEAVYVFGMIER